jgi:carbon monoxide dehydrogenase subunit G
MHFTGEFRVPGTPDEVIRRFADVPRMTGCMPGAVLDEQAPDGSWPGRMIVAFGPKKVAFKGRVTCVFDFENHTGSLHGRGSADLRAARIGVKVGFALHAAPGAAPPATLVKIVSDAELGGVLADFARTGGVAVANVIMADFAKRAAQEFARETPTPSPASPEPASPESASPESASPPAPDARRSDPEPAALSAHGLFWAVLKLQFARLARLLGLRPRDA